MNGLCTDDELEELHSPTDASEDSVEVKVRPISFRNKRKCAEPRRVADAKRRRLDGSPFRPWSHADKDPFSPSSDASEGPNSPKTPFVEDADQRFKNALSRRADDFKGLPRHTTEATPPLHTVSVTSNIDAADPPLSRCKEVPSFSDVISPDTQEMEQKPTKIDIDSVENLPQKSHKSKGFKSGNASKSKKSSKSSRTDACRRSNPRTNCAPQKIKLEVQEDVPELFHRQNDHQIGDNGLHAVRRIEKLVCNEIIKEEILEETVSKTERKENFCDASTSKQFEINIPVSGSERRISMKPSSPAVTVKLEHRLPHVYRMVTSPRMDDPLHIDTNTTEKTLGNLYDANFSPSAELAVFTKNELPETSTRYSLISPSENFVKLQHSPTFVRAHGSGHPLVMQQAIVKCVSSTVVSPKIVPENSQKSPEPCVPLINLPRNIPNYFAQNYPTPAQRPVTPSPLPINVPQYTERVPPLPNLQDEPLSLVLKNDSKSAYKEKSKVRIPCEKKPTDLSRQQQDVVRYERTYSESSDDALRPKFSVESLLGSEQDSFKDGTQKLKLNVSTSSQQQRNYKNMTRERRIEANARERTRVHTISAAFDTLRRSIPAYSHAQKLSKLSVLRIACSYILTLSRLAGLDYSADSSEPSLAECVDLVSRTIQTEGKLRKRKED